MTTKTKEKPKTEGLVTIVRAALERAAHNTKHTQKILYGRAMRDKKLLQTFLRIGICQAIAFARHSTRTPMPPLNIPQENLGTVPDLSRVDADVVRLCAAYEYQLHGIGKPIGISTHEDILDAIKEIDRNVRGFVLQRHFLVQVEVEMRNKGSKTVMEILSPERLEEMMKGESS